MLKEIKHVLNKTITENHDVAYRTTFNDNLDMFGLIGSMRNNKNDARKLLTNALSEDKQLALANLVYLRDIRDGNGERDLFRFLIKYMADEKEFSQNSANELFDLIVQVGRWDDLLVFLNDEQLHIHVIEYIKEQLRKDELARVNGEQVSLCAKWMPSINASSETTVEQAKILAKGLGMKHKAYRKTLSSLRKYISIVENNLREKDYTFEYSKIPGRAMSKYRDAFYRNDSVRFLNYLDRLESGEVTAKVKAFHPHEIISQAGFSWSWSSGGMRFRGSDETLRLMEQQWKAIERTEGSAKTIVVRDGSYSMQGTPLDVATALSILYSEQLTGPFKNKFITFSANPELVELGMFNTLQEKLEYVYQYNDMSNTDIGKVYDLIYEASLRAEPEDKIERMVIITDGEFDYMADNVPSYEVVKRKFEDAGLTLPEIVFWNVDARSIHYPTVDLANVKLVSGFSNSVLQGIMTGTTTDARWHMLEVLEPYIEYIRGHNII